MFAEVLGRDCVAHPVVVDVKTARPLDLRIASRAAVITALVSSHDMKKPEFQKR